jgi:HAD superfamily hydrolase (TIGR01509 family)
LKLVDFDTLQIVLFDFDGLLVNTEALHFTAYQNMCAKRGVDLPWDFATFCSIAHRSATCLKETILSNHPQLLSSGASWDLLYAEKKQEYMRLLDQGMIELMPGVERLLEIVRKRKIKVAVVTHSPKEQIEVIKKKIPILQSIPLWIAREDYKNAKPAPDGYLRALAELAEPGDRVVGFEDTLRGYLALEAAEVDGVVVSNVLSEPFREELLSRGANIIGSFEELLSMVV